MLSSKRARRERVPSTSLPSPFFLSFPCLRRRTQPASLRRPLPPSPEHIPTHNEGMRLRALQAWLIPITRLSFSQILGHSFFFFTPLRFQLQQKAAIVVFVLSLLTCASSSPIRTFRSPQLPTPAPAAFLPPCPWLGLPRTLGTPRWRTPAASRTCRKSRSGTRAPPWSLS